MEEEDLGDLILGDAGEEIGTSPEDEEEGDPVMRMVRRQLQREHPPSTRTLYARARQLDERVREMSLRQFHAKYPLQLKRRAGRAEGGEGGRRTSTVREGIRAALLEFARSVAEARGLEELARAVAGVDGHVEAIVRLGRAEPPG